MTFRLGDATLECVAVTPRRTKMRNFIRVIREHYRDANHLDKYSYHLKVTPWSKFRNFMWALQQPFIKPVF